MRTFDNNYDDWKVGDKVVWVDKRDICPLFTVTEINVSARWAFWEDSGTRQGSQWENLIRVTETKRDTTIMTDLEKLINELCGLPKYDLEGDEDTIVVRWEQGINNSIFIWIGEWNESIYLDPSQALTLLEWLGSQRQNLEDLRDALQAQKAQEEATKAEREAERITALKAKHSDAVVAWQQGGCAGPCPSFEEMVKVCLVDPVLIASRNERKA